MLLECIVTIIIRTVRWIYFLGSVGWELELDVSVNPSHPTDDIGEESWRLYIYPLLSLRWRSNFRLKPASEHLEIISSSKIFHSFTTLLLKENLATSSLTTLVHIRYMLSPDILCLSVVCNVCAPYSHHMVQIFRNISTALGTLAIHWHPLKILWRLAKGNPSAGGVKHKRGSKI